MALILTNVIQDMIPNNIFPNNCRSDTLCHNANAGGTKTFKPYNSKNVMKNNFITVF